VIGIECVAQGIEDAKYNASANGIENCEFFCGRAEDLLPTLGEKITGSEVVAVVDPPRGGLRKWIFDYLKSYRLIHIIYLSKLTKIYFRLKFLLNISWMFFFICVQM
jgi:tRNA (uracil-5-)-methyltransferase